MITIKDLENEINRIKERNKRVEIEKAWETSWTRRFIIAIFTYVVISIFFIFVGTPDPLENAIVPSVAFILSTLSGPVIKKLWLKYVFKK